jgi:hypothetical protein
MNHWGVLIKEMRDHTSFHWYFLLVTEPSTWPPTYSIWSKMEKHHFSWGVDGTTLPPSLNLSMTDNKTAGSNSRIDSATLTKLLHFIIMKLPAELCLLRWWLKVTMTKPASSRLSAVWFGRGLGHFCLNLNLNLDCIFRKLWTRTPNLNLRHQTWFEPGLDRNFLVYLIISLS